MRVLSREDISGKLFVILDGSSSDPVGLAPGVSNSATSQTVSQAAMECEEGEIVGSPVGKQDLRAGFSR